MNKKKGFFKFLKPKRALAIIITAAIMIELVSAVQYYNTYKLLEVELQRKAELELVMKAILIKSTLNSAEDILKNHEWDLQRNLHNPDSLAEAVKRLVLNNRYVCGGAMALMPDYYPAKGRLYEPYARVIGKEQVEMLNLADESHDYTQRDFFKKATESDTTCWIDPYIDNEGAQGIVTTFISSIYDLNNNKAGVAAIDVSVDWLSDSPSLRDGYAASAPRYISASSLRYATMPMMQLLVSFDSYGWNYKILSTTKFHYSNAQDFEKKYVTSQP